MQLRAIANNVIESVARFSMLYLSQCGRPFNKRLCALSRSSSGVPEHLSHTCYPRHTYPNFNLILTYMVVKHLSSYHVLLVGNTI